MRRTLLYEKRARQDVSKISAGLFLFAAFMANWKKDFICDMSIEHVVSTWRRAFEERRMCMKIGVWGPDLY